MPDKRDIVAVAGASGYVGSALGPALARRFKVIGLSRSSREPSDGYAEWRSTDLFSLTDAERALEGASLAVYLVHSMLPTDRLVQGSFEDFDLICADNFARAAKRANVRRIIYLSGLVPSEDESKLSRHLGSRLETERALAAHGACVVTLRAGLVIGRGGSSFEMMVRLVRRLPMMACPAWTRTKTQPVALDDVVRVIDLCLDRDDVAAGAYDIGCTEVLSYREMMQETAKVLGLRRPMIEVPFLTTGLSRLWVSLVTGAPRELVAPLIGSLVHPMVARDLSLQHSLGLVPQHLGEALRDAVEGSLAPQDRAHATTSIATRSHPEASLRARTQLSRSRVRSIQRMDLPPERDAAWVAREYVEWVSRRLRLIIKVVKAEHETRFLARFLQVPLLVFSAPTQRSTPDRQVLHVTGGVLADTRAPTPPWPRLEFLVVNQGQHVLAAVHDFVPRLPWPLYLMTQAVVHLMVMRSFARHLKRLRRATLPLAHGGTS